MSLTLKKSLLECDSDKRNILKWALDKPEENFRLRSGVGHSEDIGPGIGHGKRKSRLLGNPARPCTSYAYNPIEEKYRNISVSPRFATLEKILPVSRFHVATHTHYLYPIRDSIVGITARRRTTRKLTRVSYPLLFLNTLPTDSRLIGFLSPTIFLIIWAVICYLVPRYLAQLRQLRCFVSCHMLPMNEKNSIGESKLVVGKVLISDYIAS